MTWAQTSVGRTVTRTGLFLKKQLWIWPIIAFVILSIVGFSVHIAIESTMKSNLRSELQTLLAVETAMLEKWLEVQSSNVESAANSLPFREKAYRLLETEDRSELDAETIDEAGIQHDIAKTLAPVMASHDFVGYVITDRSKQIVASSHAVLISV